MRIDGRFFLVSLLLSLLFHLFVFGVVFYFKGLFFFKNRPLLNFYEISIVGSISPNKGIGKVKGSSNRSVKKKASVKAVSKTKKRTSVSKKEPNKKAEPLKKTPKKEILVSKKRPRKKVSSKKVKRSLSSNSRKSRKKRSKKVSDESLLNKKIKELEEEKYLQQKLAQLKKSSEGGEGYVSESEGTGIKIKGKAEVDPLLAFYVAKLVERIRVNWILPEAKKGLEAIVDVKINKKGEAVEIKFEKRSGDIVFDESCIRAVKRSFPFEPLPFTYKEEYLEIGVRFKL